MDRLWRLLKKETVTLHLRKRKKEEVIEELIDVLVRATLITDKVKALEGVLQRERMMSTGIGEEVAIPHAKYDHIDKPLLAFGRSSEGIKFESLDGKKVHLVFLLLSPKDEPTKYVKLLGKMARLLDRTEVRETLKRALTPEEIINTIKQEERRLR